MEPKDAINQDDINLNWTTGEKGSQLASFDWLGVWQFPVEIPIDPIWSPSFEFKLFERAQEDVFIGSGTLNIADLLPWVHNKSTIMETIGARTAMGQAYGGEDDTLTVTDSGAGDGEGEDELEKELRLKRKRRRDQMAALEQEDAAAKSVSGKTGSVDDADGLGMFLDQDSEVEDDELVGDRLVKMAQWHRPQHPDLPAWFEEMGQEGADWLANIGRNEARKIMKKDPHGKAAVIAAKGGGKKGKGKGKAKKEGKAKSAPPAVDSDDDDHDKTAEMWVPSDQEDDGPTNAGYSSGGRPKAKARASKQMWGLHTPSSYSGSSISTAGKKLLAKLRKKTTNQTKAWYF